MNLWPYRLIAVDLDGTLRRSDHVADPEGVRTLAWAAQQGLYVVLATTRNAYAAREDARAIGGRHPMVCSNGAQVWASPDGPVWVNRVVPRDLASAIATMADTRDWDLVITVGETTYRRPRDGQGLGPQDAHHVIVARNADMVAKGDVIRILCYDLDAIPELCAMVKAKFAGQYHLESYYYANHVLKSIGIYAPGSDKGTALTYVLARLGIAQDAVIAIGDNANDLPMFDCARVRVAMGNATDDVKQRATLIAPTNDASGVAWAIRHLLQQENVVSMV